MTYGFLPIVLIGRNGTEACRGFIKATKYPTVVSRGMHVYVIRDWAEYPAHYEERYSPPVFSAADIECLP